MDKKVSHWDSVVSRFSGEAISPVISPSFTVPEKSTIFTIGSCFARNIEEYLDVLGFNVPTLDFVAPFSESPNRPNGVLNKYTPTAIYEELNWAMQDCDSEDDFIDSIQPFMFKDSNGIIDLQLGYHTISEERFIERRAELYNLWQKVREASCVTITLGLIERWVDKSTGLSISGAPSTRSMLKERKRFEFSPLSYMESFNYVKKTIELIFRVAPKAKILITTSPVPLQKTFKNEDVLIANQASKSQLRTVCDEVVKEFENVDYFPSYEMIAFPSPKVPFGKDLRHVRDNAVGDVITLLTKEYFDDVDETRRDLQLSLRDLSAKLKNTPAMERVLSEIPIEALNAKDALLYSRIAWRCNKRHIATEILLHYFNVAEPNARDLKALAYLANKCKLLNLFEDYLSQVIKVDPSNNRALQYLEDI